MSNSTLDPDNIPAGTDRSLGKGHDTGSLGPSDNSDSGSDMQGQPGLDSDTDASGTGERGDVENDALESGGDIDTDHIETLPPDGVPADRPLTDEGMKEGDVERADVDHGRGK